jgi:hypothetical protein
MIEPNDPFPLNAKEPEPWDRAGTPPALPFPVQEAAIEELLRQETALPVVKPPLDLAADLSVPPPAVEQEPVAAPLVEEFKPTDAEWMNVKEALLPHPNAVPLDEEQHPTHKPHILERDALGFDGGGDWNEV